MAAFVFPSRPNDGGNQPPVNARIDRQSPQAVGLEACYPLSTQAYYTDLVKHNNLSFDDDNTSSGFRQGYDGIYGRGYFNDGTSGLQAPCAGWTSIFSNAGAPLSFTARARPDVVDSANHYVVTAGASVANNCPLMILNSSNKWRMGFFGLSNADTAASAVAGTPVSLAGTYDGTSVRIYVDGLLKTTQATAAGNVAGGGVVLMSIGEAPYDATHNNFNGFISDVRVYGRCLSDTDVHAIFDPSSRWDLYYQARTWSLFDLGATSSFSAARARYYPQLGVA